MPIQTHMHIHTSNDWQEGEENSFYLWLTFPYEMPKNSMKYEVSHGMLHSVVGVPVYQCHPSYKSYHMIKILKYLIIFTKIFLIFETII